MYYDKLFKIILIQAQRIILMNLDFSETKIFNLFRVIKKYATLIGFNKCIKNALKI